MYCPVTFKLQRPQSLTITQSKHEGETNFTIGLHVGICCGLGGRFFVLFRLISFFGWLVSFQETISYFLHDLETLSLHMPLNKESLQTGVNFYLNKELLIRSKIFKTLDK